MARLTERLLWEINIHNMKESPFWEANGSLVSQEIPRTQSNPKVHYRLHKSPPKETRIK